MEISRIVSPLNWNEIFVCSYLIYFWQDRNKNSYWRDLLSC